MAFTFTPVQTQLDQSLEHCKQDLQSLRTGKATVQLLDPVMVEAYGSHMKLVEVASVSAPDANMLLVAPWDRSLLTAVEKAIGSAGLNLNPVVDQDVIRIVVPPLTAERRQDMVKLLHQKIEAAKVTVRNIRSDAKRDIDGQSGNAGISEDDIHRDEEELEKRIKAALASLDELQTKKEAELLTV